jgi:starch-binding outer membrane protein, SusD/RagB family
MRYSKTRVIAAAIVAVLSASCDRDILDVQPQDRLAESVVWADEGLTRAYHNELYHSVQHGFGIHMASKYTDEAFNNAPCCGAHLFARNTLSPDNVAELGGTITDFWANGNNHMYFWDKGYTYNRKINLFIEKAETGEIDFEGIDRLVAEAKFLRALLYFELFKRFGGVPIVTEAYELDAVGEELFERATPAEVVAFIQNDIAAAMPDLAERYASSEPNYGRGTQDAALALRSELLLYWASPLHNPSGDMQRWQDASDAAAAVLDRGYSLYPDYEELFQLPTGSAQNEIIFARPFSITSGHLVPGENLPRRWGGYGGWWASNGPSQNLVDDYDMINGEPAFLDVPNQIVNQASGYDPGNPYANRDPRLAATIIYHGARIDNIGDHPAAPTGSLYEPWESPDGEVWGLDSPRHNPDNTASAMALRKFMPQDGVLIGRQFSYTNPWPIFRLAGIYLNYAEAQLALGNEAVAREYISMVRARPSVDLPPIPADVTGEALRKRLINERRIELAFEGHRFFDIRRWLIAAEVENTPVRGMVVTCPANAVASGTCADLDPSEFSYNPNRVLLQKPAYPEAQNLLPVSTNELQRNPGLAQTPGW